jgi:hypothetical protein
VSDILVIPEIFSNVMSQTKNMPCKRVVLLQNFNYLTEFIPIGATWEDFKIYDVVTTSKGQEKLIKEIFPNIRSQIVSPSISNTIFRESKESKQPIVNIVAKNQSDVNKIVKPFYWKYPTYKWVSFRDLRGLPKTEFAKSLQEAAITVWVDTDTNFGYSPIEAIKCGSIVIGKIPETIPDWMINENGELKDNGVWFSNMNSVHELIASVLRAWTYDEIPNEIADEMQNMNDLYTNEIQKEEIKKVYIDGFVKQRKTEIEILVNTFKNNNKEEEKVTEE